MKTLNYITIFIFISIFASYASGQGSTFKNPILSTSSPDPFVVLVDGIYYMILSDSHTKMFVLKSEFLTDWRDAYEDRVQIYEAPEGMDNLFAPELHLLDNHWHVYFAFDNHTDAMHRMYVIKALEAGGDPQSVTYLPEERVTIPEDDYFAIDGTILEMNNKRYFIYSGWENATLDPECTDPPDVCFLSYMWIAEMSDYKTLGHRRLLKMPEEAWEGRVIEGAQIFTWDNKRFFMFYSAASTWNDTYSMSVMYIDEPMDPMDRHQWTRWPCQESPLFWKSVQNDVHGPGHGMLTFSPSGEETWLVYHAMDSSWNGANRTARVQKIEWDSWGDGGFPVFPRPSSFQDELRVPHGQLIIDIDGTTTDSSECRPDGSSSSIFKPVLLLTLFALLSIKIY